MKQADAKLCPVCSGSGKIETQDSWSTSQTKDYKICNGCGGKGWIVIEYDVYYTGGNFTEGLE